jgi:hypothetical protein
VTKGEHESRVFFFKMDESSSTPDNLLPVPKEEKHGGGVLELAAPWIQTIELPSL